MDSGELWESILAKVEKIRQQYPGISDDDFKQVIAREFTPDEMLLWGSITREPTEEEIVEFKREFPDFTARVIAERQAYIAAKQYEADFADLERLNLSPEVAESIKQARIEARVIIGKLEPHHITSWEDLLQKLDVVRAGAHVSRELFDVRR